MVGWEIPAGAAVTLLLAVVGWIWRLSWKLATHGERISVAQTVAANASAKATIVEQELSQHKEHVAAEYLSKDSMKGVMDAINRLGDRLDRLFIQLLPKP